MTTTMNRKLPEKEVFFIRFLIIILFFDAHTLLGDYMCTAIRWKWKEQVFFGRTLDSAEMFAQKVVITPRNYQFKFNYCEIEDRHLAILGMATVYKNYPLYAEAVNEKGLCIAALEFPSNSHYFPFYPSKVNITPFEIIPFILRQCQNIQEVKEIIKKTQLVDKSFDEIVLTVPLHWMISDNERSIVIESTEGGLKVYDDVYNVMTNNPPFPYHQENIANYINLTSAYPSNRFSKALDLMPFSNGMGGLGLPGDFSSPSRFVKASFLTCNSLQIESYDEAVAQFFHVLDAVSPLKGSVKNQNQGCVYTIYSCCIDLKELIYYFKTYWNNTINAVTLDHENCGGSDLIVYQIDFQHSSFLYLN